MMCRLRLVSLSGKWTDSNASSGLMFAFTARLQVEGHWNSERQQEVCTDR